MKMDNTVNEFHTMEYIHEDHEDYEDNNNIYDSDEWHKDNYTDTEKQNMKELLEKHLTNVTIWNFKEFSVEHLSEGFYGTVFKATHKRTREVSVLKVLKDTYGDDMKKEMFLEEIRLLHKVCHPNVLKCKGITFIHGKICFLSEYVAGDTLEQLIAKQICNPISWEVILHICLDIAKGMAYLHSQYIIHRDLSSRNIVTRQINEHYYEAIIIDFGLSYQKPAEVISEDDEDSDCPCGPIGSPFHLAPELFKDKPCSFKTDVFSFGIILCEIIAGCPGADPDELPRTKDFGLNVEEFSAMAYEDCPSQFLNVAVMCCQMQPKLRPSFLDISKMIDIIIDFQNDKSMDHLVLEESLLCACHRKERNTRGNIENVFEESYNRLGVIQRNGSRKLANETFRRCSLCGGRCLSISNNNDHNNNENTAMEKPSKKMFQIGEVANEIAENHSDITNELHLNLRSQSSTEEDDDTKSPPIHIEPATPEHEKPANRKNVTFPSESPRYSTLEKARKFPAGVLLNQDTNNISRKTNQLADNTPGFLPRFFSHILRRRKSYINLINNGLEAESPRRILHKFFHFSAHHCRGSRKDCFDVESQHHSFNQSHGDDESLAKCSLSISSSNKKLTNAKRQVSSQPALLQLNSVDLSSDFVIDMEPKTYSLPQGSPKSKVTRSKSFMNLFFRRRSHNT